MGTTEFDIVAEFGADPTGAHPCDIPLSKAIAAATKFRLPVYFPGAGSVFNAAGQVSFNDVDVVGDGGRLRRADNVPVPAPGYAQHLAVWNKYTRNVVVRGLHFDGNAVNQGKGFAGDTLRVQYGTGNIDFGTEGITAYNSAGYTTTSVPNVSVETFAAQFLRCKGKIRGKVHALALDGGSSATGIVSHWCDDFWLDGCVSAFHKGQGFGTYGGGTSTTSPGTRLTNYVGYYNHHNVNIEAGDNQTLHFVGSNLVSIGGVRGLVINGTLSKSIPAVMIDGFTSTNDQTVLAVTGAVPQAVALDRFTIVDPIKNVVNLLAGSNNAKWANLSKLTNSTLHNSNNVPTIAPTSVKQPTHWQLKAA